MYMKAAMLRNAGRREEMAVDGRKYLPVRQPSAVPPFLRYSLTFSMFLVYNTGVHKIYARVAQWWSIALPRRGSRVRIPSRAFRNSVLKRWISICGFEGMLNT